MLAGRCEHSTSCLFGSREQIFGVNEQVRGRRLVSRMRCAWPTPAPAVSVTLHFRSKGEKEGLPMKSIAIASLFVLIGTAAQAEIMCSETGVAVGRRASKSG